MNLHKTHPEAHDAWLYAMGIDVRWRHRSAPSEEPVTQPLSIVSVAEETMLPVALAQARCWVVGDASLSESERRILAAMLWSVGWAENDVIYMSLEASSPNMNIEITRMSVAHFQAWSYLSESTISGASLQKFMHIASSCARPPMSWLMGSAQSLAVQGNQIIALPSISALMHAPQLKQSAWEQIKALRVSA